MHTEHVIPVEPAKGLDMLITGVQCRMARAALDIGVRELAKLADVSTATVVRFEKGDSLHTRTITAMQAVLEARGVEFTNGEQPGVKLKRKP